MHTPDLAPSPPDTAKRLGLHYNGIHWTDRTLGIGVFGCEHVSPACTHCWAEGMAARIVRMGGDEPSFNSAAVRYAQVVTDGRWNRHVVVRPEMIAPAFATLPKRASDRCRRVWPGSMTDLFHEDVPFPFITRVLVEMHERRHIDFQILTKRADRLAEYWAWLDRDCGGKALWPSNAWIGVTAERQREADERIPHLLRVPAAVRFLSVEPMLGRVNLRAVRHTDGKYESEFDTLRGWVYHDDGSDLSPRLSWVIVGSESDGPRPGPRKTDPAWVVDLVNQCDAASVPVFLKQLEVGGKLCTLPLLNGRVRAEFPEVPGV